MKDSRSDSYAAAGVDVTAGYKAVDFMRKHVESTYTKGVLGGIGGFGGLFEPQLSGIRRPVLVSGTDGVGTKLKIAFLMNKHDTVGIDCVAMCVNDIVCSGAAPLFFLDYIATGKNDPEKIASIVKGMAKGCRQAGCALIGGETAEMPGFYESGEYDLAGFCVGLCDYDKIIDGKSIRPGDKLIGLSSSGIHSNGYSLVRHILRPTEDKLTSFVPTLDKTLGEAILEPTKIYVKAVLNLAKAVRIKGISHITGGGFYENVPRMLSVGLRAQIQKGTWAVPPIFPLLMDSGNIPEHDMYNTFNMGIGMVIAVSNSDVNEALDSLKNSGENAQVIGSVIAGETGVDLV